MENGGKGSSSAKGKTPTKKLASKRAKEPVNSPHVNIDSDDSEGFLEEKNHSNTKGKSSATKSKGLSSSRGGVRAGLYAAPKRPPKNEGEITLQLDIPKTGKVLMDCEAADILQEVQEHMVILSEDPTIKIPLSFDKAYQYSKDGKHYLDTNSVKTELESLKSCGVNDGEICMIANIGADTVDEVYALIPSLKENKFRNEGPIKSALDNLLSVKIAK